MRKIKVRGYSVEKLCSDSQWLEGFGVLVLELADGGEEYFLYTSSGTYQVHGDSIGEYTGLKDKSGTEIFEGDILEFDDVGEEGYEYKEGYDFTNRATVVFNEGRFELNEFVSDNSSVIEEMNYSCHEDFIATFKQSKVVGNIYENSKMITA